MAIKPDPDCTEHRVMLCGETKKIVNQKQAEYLMKGIKISIETAIIKIIHEYKSGREIPTNSRK